jgi:putative transposase
MRYGFMKAHKNEFSIERMSKVLGVSQSGYYAYENRKPSRRMLENERLLLEIKMSHEQSRQTYGSVRICEDLRANGETCSRKRVAKIMNQSGIKAKMSKRFKVTTKANPTAIPAPNLLQQDFSAEGFNQRWVADFTYVSTKEGWLYVATVMDLFSRRIVGLAMSDRMKDDLVISALQQAFIHRQPDFGLVHHSDRGSQYTSQDFQNLLAAYGITASMSSTGNCYDNAAMESFYHTLKTEHIYFEHYETREQAKQSIFEWVEIFYNRQRRHSTLGYVSPMVFEKQWQQQQMTIRLQSVH